MRDRRPRFPGYDVLAKRDSPSWNEQTRRVIDARLAAENEPRFCTPDEWQTLKALCDCIVPQEGSAQVAIAAMIDRKLERDQRDGYRPAALPPQRVAWRRGLRAVDDEARSRYGVSFHELRRFLRGLHCQQPVHA